MFKILGAKNRRKNLHKHPIIRPDQGQDIEMKLKY